MRHASHLKRADGNDQPGIGSWQAPAPADVLPLVLAVSRMPDDHCSLRVICARRPTDDELRAVFERLNVRGKAAPTAAPK